MMAGAVVVGVDTNHEMQQVVGMLGVVEYHNRAELRTRRQADKWLEGKKSPLVLVQVEKQRRWYALSCRQVRTYVKRGGKL